MNEQVDRKLGLTRNIAKRLDDSRQAGKIRHESEAIFRQRVYGLSAGWEDLNDADELRHDTMHQIAVGKDEALASAHRWWANQWRILLSALAYTLLEALRRFALKGSALARATVATIRLKLIKIGAVIVRKASVIRIHLSSHHPLKDLFTHAAARLSPP